MPAEIVTRSQHTITITAATHDGDRVEVRTTADGGAGIIVSDSRSSTAVVLTRTEARTLAAWIEEHVPAPCGSGDQT